MRSRRMSFSDTQHHIDKIVITRPISRHGGRMVAMTAVLSSDKVVVDCSSCGAAVGVLRQIADYPECQR